MNGPLKYVVLTALGIRALGHSQAGRAALGQRIET